jgi:hypothetical protein
VISSAFQSAEATALDIGWEPATSVADLDLLLRWAREHLDAGAVAVLGHSYGAQAALIYAMEGRAIDAVVSLDSTLENGEPGAPWWKGEAPQRVWLDRAAAISVPALVVSTEAATSTAFFDGMTGCDRRSLQVPALDHNDLEAFGGLVQATFAADLREPVPPAERVRAGHQLVVRATLAFLDGILRQQPAALARLDGPLPAGLPGAKLIHVARPPGCPAPPALLAAIRAEGIAATGTRAAGLAGCDARAALIDIAGVLRAADDGDRAVEVMRWLTRRDPEDFLAQKNLAESLVVAGKLPDARAAYQRALVLLGKTPASSARRKQMVELQLRARLALVDALAGRGRDASP